jgi:uncharacterized protein (TIGR00730 family)
MKNLRVSVFGGSRTNEGEPDYIQAQRLGQILGEMGCTVMTGGYIGAMEAVSRGAAEAGGLVIGVTCDEIEAWRPVRPNRWVEEEIRRQSLKERMFTLIEECQAAIALPGGPGTLTEIAVMWNQLLTGAIPPRPLILVGKSWQKTIDQFYQSLDAYIPQEQRKWLLFAEDVDRAIDVLLDHGFAQNSI